MSHPKYRLRGYLYQIVEVFPCEEADLGVRELTTHDRLEDAETVMAALESVNYNFTCYAIILRPVWEDTFAPKTKLMEEMFKDGWDANGSPVFTPCDHNGSTASLSTDGKYTFHCHKCGVKYGNTP